MSKSINQEGFSALDIVLAVALIAAIGVAGLFAYQNTRNKTSSSSAPKSSNSQSPSPTASPLPDGWAKFTHPTARYSLYYPKDWKGGLSSALGTNGYFEEFHIETPDHRVVAQGVPDLEQGAEIAVTAQKNDQSLDDVYSSNQIGAVVNRNKTATEVDGQPAIQYDYAYEQIRATVTMLTKGGVVYWVTFRYVDDKGKQALWGDYAQLLASFKLN